MHIARYAAARPFCRGRRILDIACGEGHGARLLIDWGAREVIGVDASADAIASARRHFGSGNLLFEQCAADHIFDVVEKRPFDLVVSFDTIDHVDDVGAFLTDIRKALSPGGQVILSCPNDGGYRESPPAGLPHHARRYRLSEFREVTEKVLGPASAWYLGGPVNGFVNSRIPVATAAPCDLQVLMMPGAAVSDVVAVPADRGTGPTEENCSYFLAVWGAEGPVDSSFAGGGLLPVSMTALRASGAGAKQAEPGAGAGERNAAEPAPQKAPEVPRSIQLLVKALRLELELCKASVAELRAQRDEIAARHSRVVPTGHGLESGRTEAQFAGPTPDDEDRLYANRYRRLRNLVPTPIRRLFLAVLRSIGR